MSRGESSSLSDNEIIAAYERTGSVWRAGNELGIRGQTVSRRLAQANYPTAKRWITEADRQAIRDYYLNTPAEIFDLAVLVAKLGRSKQTIAKCAGEMGLTDQGRPNNATVIANQVRAAKEVWKTVPHPRGMAGKKHGDDAKRVMSIASKKMWATHKAFDIGLMSPEMRAARSIASSQSMIIRRQKAPESIHTRAKGGKRADLGDQYFRSSWEANYARYLNLLKKMGVVVSWQYEPKTFWFSGVKRGVVSYLPDFLVFFKGDEFGEYHEVKGWIVPKDRTKWARMAKYYPDVKLVIVDHAAYRSIKLKWAAAIPNWETGHNKTTTPRATGGRYKRTRFQMLAAMDREPVE